MVSSQRLIFFFFQAEDGIRDVAVTGVQTCALPISSPVPITKSQVHQVLIAIGHVRQAELVLPVADILLWRVVILPPVIFACLEKVGLSLTGDIVPAKPQDVSILMPIVIARIPNGQRCRSIRARGNRLAVRAAV